MTWQRREFLEAAITSVLAQTVPRSDYEIVVVKGYKDERSDAFLRACGARAYQTASPDRGPALATAVAHARGNVVAFLDDDDEFEPQKLATLRQEFEADPSLVLVRHSNRNIDVRGDRLSEWPVCDWPALPPPTVRVLSTPEEKQRAPTLPMHNLSTIALRRSAILHLLPHWSTVEAASDSMVFLSGLAQPGTVRIDPRVLSRRRIHASVSLETFSSVGASPPETTDQLRQLIRSHTRQFEMVRDTPAEPSARWIALILRFDAAMSSESFPDPTLRDYVAMLRGIERERQPFRLWIVGFAVARRFSPQRAIAAWWRFSRRRHRTLYPQVDYPRLFPRSPTRASMTSASSSH